MAFKIIVPVLTNTGATIATDAVVSYLPYLSQLSQLKMPCDLLWHLNAQAKIDGYDNIWTITSPENKTKLSNHTFTLTPAETNFPTKTIIEGHLMAYLESIYGAGDVVAQLNALLARLRVTGGNGLIAD